MKKGFSHKRVSEKIKLIYKYSSKFYLSLPLRFEISEDGTHAAAVVFSDAGSWTKVTIKFNDFFTSTGFRNAIYKSEKTTYRTRIDRAFDLATDIVFKKENGKFSILNQ